MWPLNSSFSVLAMFGRGGGGNFSVPFPQQAVMPAEHQQSPAQYNQAQPPVQVQGHGEQSGSEAGGTLAFLLPLKSLRSST